VSDRDVIDAEYRVVEPRQPWRIRFWPSVLFWVYVCGVYAAARQALPTADPGAVAAIVLMAAGISPVLRMFGAMISALTGGDRVDEQWAQQERQNRLSRGA
jgi:hypothetical protein